MQYDLYMHPSRTVNKSLQNSRMTDLVRLFFLRDSFSGSPDLSLVKRPQQIQLLQAPLLIVLTHVHTLEYIHSHV